MSIETFTQVAGRRIVAADTAESIGTVKGFVLDQGGGQIDAIHRGGASMRQFWRGTRSPRSVPTPNEADPSNVDSDHQKAAVKGDIAPIGSRVVTTDGVAIGLVDDIEFNTESGAVVRVLTRHGPINATRVRSLGSDALVVDPDSNPAGRGHERTAVRTSSAHPSTMR